MTVTPSLHRKLEKELTYHIPSFNSVDEYVQIKNLKVLNYNLQGGNLLVAFPVGRVDLIPDSYEVVDKRVYNPVEFPEFKYELRGSQQDLYDELEDNCIMNAKVGWGKTFWAIAAATKLKQKTLVVVHTVALRNQWEKEIVKTLGIKPGVIGSGKFNIDSPIVVANVQTLAKHVQRVSREFGTVILDEMHHVSSPTFSKVVDAMFSRYKLGLSGTIERKDGKHVVFRDYFGNTVFSPKVENTLTPEVHVVNAGIHFGNNATMPWAERVNILKESPLYKHLIVGLADTYADMGHRVLVVSDRVDFLAYCHKNTSNSSSLFIGEVKTEADREAIIQDVTSGKSKILFGTQSMVSEGLSINPLSCLILGTPLNNLPLLEQLVGRIQRQAEGKLSPVVVDVRLLGNTVERQYSNRLGHYMKQGYNVVFIK